MEKNKILRLFVIINMIAFATAGCNYESSEVSDIETTVADNAVYLSGEEDGRAEENIETIYRDIYAEVMAEAAETNTLAGLETLRSIISGLGEHGYSAVDSENQIDMVRSDQMERFCRQAEAQEEAEAALIVVITVDSFIKYEFTTNAGSVEVFCKYYLYKDGYFETVSTNYFPAYTWVYDEEGYLFFEEYHMPGYDGSPGHTAIRIAPLEERCRELNRNYIKKIGYELNNLFTSDWSEDDFNELNFYDLYEVLYQMKDETASRLRKEGEIYEIPKREFEDVFQTFFKVDGQTLQQYTIYRKDVEMYQYRTRGMFDFAPTQCIPYPEVVSYEEKQDGTIKLTVNAVWPEENLEKAFCHEVVIRLLEDGGFQYVSNHVISSEDNVEPAWYTERLSDDEWWEYYGKKGLTIEEEQNLQDEAMAAAKQCMEFYKDIRIADPLTSYSHIENFSDEQRKSVVKCLGKQGLVCVSDDMNMENYQKMEEFYSVYSAGDDVKITVFRVNIDGSINALTLIHRSGKIQSYYVSIGWEEGGIPEIKDSGSNALEEMKLTEKGYFIYTYVEPIAHGNLREYYRVKPLSDKCRELTEKYIKGLSFVNYNMLVTNWDISNVEEILMPCMFEDIYRMYTNEPFKMEQGMIPAEIYERVMTTCFPVSVEQVREYCGYHVDADGYEYEMIFPRQFPPFGEVVDYAQNGDGTITLYVDAVWPDYNSDYAFTNTIAVLPFADGTFRYLSNSVEQRELEVPRIEG